jgi:hypothetical protein
MFGGLWKIDKFRAGLETLLQEGKVVFACLNKLGCLFELGQATGGLHVANLEVVAQMAIGVFVVVAEGQLAQLLAEAFVAGIVLAGLAVAITSPVSEALGNGLELFVIGKYRTALAHGDVVRRVKAQRGNVAKGAHHLTAVAWCPAHRSNLPPATACMLLAQGRHHVQVKGVTQRCVPA